MSTAIAWPKDDFIRIPSKGTPVFLSAGIKKPKTSDGESFSFKKIHNIQKCCVLIYFQGSEPIIESCSTDIKSIITKYTATPEKKRKYEKIKRNLYEKLRSAALGGNINRIKYYRLINNMDQKTLARLTGIKQPNISRLEKIGYKAHPDTYKRIAKVLGVDYKELLP